VVGGASFLCEVSSCDHWKCAHRDCILVPKKCVRKYLAENRHGISHLPPDSSEKPNRNAERGGLGSRGPEVKLGILATSL
jgi:hypothetical protein